MTIEAVVFDLDGTLADSAHGITTSYRHALERFGLRASDDAIRACIGPPLGESLARLGVPSELVPAAVDAYRDHFSSTGIYDNTMFPGIPAVLDALRADGLSLALATSKREDFAGRILDLFEIAHLFEAVAGAAADGTRTAKSDIVCHALAGLGHPDSAAVVVVGDRRDDVEAAQTLGAGLVAVTWGYGSRDELREAGATVFAGDPAELLRIIRANLFARS